jgi:hypothetical protein
MKKTIFIIVMCFLIITSCKYFNFKRDCYLDFRLGMQEYEYNHIVKKYIKEGILREELSKSRYDHPDDKSLLTRLTSSNLEGLVEPIFLNDKLDELRIFIGEDLSYNSKPVTAEMYGSIVNDFKKEYGTPTQQSTDSITGHKLTIWQTKYSYMVEVILMPEDENRKSQIGVYFTPAGELKKELDDYNEKKKLYRD